MKLAAVCFTLAGSRLCAGLAEKLKAAGYEFTGYGPVRFKEEGRLPGELKPLTESLDQWTRRQFEEADGLLFLCAAGIAVRAIAPFLRDKAHDPAVVVMDEAGQFAVPVLSGHLGGANELACFLAELTGGQPVITTATDVNGLFSVDDFARQKGLFLSDLSEAKAVSATLLDGREIGFFSDFPVEGKLPVGLCQGKLCEANIWITMKAQRQPHVLKLIPPITYLGIGCRKGTPVSSIEKAVKAALEKADISIESVAAVASIELKKEEPGLIAFASSFGVLLHTYDAAALMSLEGEFSQSSFVKSVTGADNVCERAAILCACEPQNPDLKDSMLYRVPDCTGLSGDACKGATLRVRKYVENGVTVAAAVKDWKVIL